MRDNLNTVILIGSARENRVADRVLKWLIPELAKYPDFSIRLADARDFDAGGVKRRAAIRLLEADVSAADAVIVLTPEYNHSFPAPLKTMLDCLGEPWKKKPVAFISYGGISGGLRAVEQLRLVAAELDMADIRETVSIQSPWTNLDEEGEPRFPEQLNASLARQMTALAWWGYSLRAARNIEIRKGNAA
ncbi:MAG: reductase [Rhizobium sp.]|nr:reductase [Rhizobium sp.]